MKKIQNLQIAILFVLALTFAGMNSFGQDTYVKFGKSVGLQKLTSKTKEKEIPLNWINVNTAPDTWYLQKNILVCKGQPIGVMRSEKQYENFILHVEWMHMEAGGNSGVFVWSNANPPEETRLPDGVEVQMLELDWVNLNKRDGVCIDGVIKLSVNGKVVNGISQSSQKKGYICLESEGAEIHFRNLMIVELSPGVTSAEQTAPVR